MPRMYRETPMDPVLLLWTKMAWPWSTIPLWCSPEDVDLFKVMLNPGERLTARLSNSPRFPGSKNFRCGWCDAIALRSRARRASGSASDQCCGRSSLLLHLGRLEQSSDPRATARGAPFILNLGVESSELCPDPEAEGEPNNEQAQASFPPPGIEEIERHFCGETDVDWYLIQPEPETEVRVTAAFAGGEGDIDLYLFRCRRRACGSECGR